MTVEPTYSAKFGVVQYRYHKLAEEVIVLCEEVKSADGVKDAQEMLVRSIAKLAMASIELEKSE